MVKKGYHQLWRLLRTVVCIECPCPSLAGVLIKSLLVYTPEKPKDSLPCHLPLPIPRIFPLFLWHALWTPPSLQLHSNALIQASSFLFSRWSAGYMCECVLLSLRWPKHAFGPNYESLPLSLLWWWEVDPVFFCFPCTFYVVKWKQCSVWGGLESLEPIWQNNRSSFFHHNTSWLFPILTKLY